MSDFAPTAQSKAFREEISTKIDIELAKWRDIKQNDIPEINALVKQKSVDAIILN